MFDFIVGNIGTVFNFTITTPHCKEGKDLTSAISTTLYIKYPDGTTQSRVCTIVEPLNGLVSYTTVAGDFPISGTYLLQISVQFATNVFNSEIAELLVGSNIIPSTPV